MDILDPALSLEDTYYTEGRTLGQADGTKAGLVEGRRFGLEKAFEKFASIGRLHGRSIVWNSRTQQDQTQVSNPVPEATSDLDHKASANALPRLFSPLESAHDDLSLEDLPLLPRANQDSTHLPELGSGSSISRLQKHIVTLYALTELESLAIENTEEAVTDFDDRYRRAVAKVGIVGRMIGEHVDVGVDGLASIEDSTVGRDGSTTGQQEPEMEDLMEATRHVGQGRTDHSRGDEELEFEIR